MPESPSTFLSTWWSGWRHAGLGSPGAQPTGDGLLGFLGYAFLGAMGLMRTVLILGTIPVGALGAWRLAKPIGSARASVASFAVYLAIPVPYNALASGSWTGLLVYAISPWMLLALGRASGAAPFGPAGADPAEPAAQLRKRSLLSLVLGLGLGLAVVAVLVPFVVVLVVVIAGGAHDRLDPVLPDRRPRSHAAGGPRRRRARRGPEPAVDARPGDRPVAVGVHRRHRQLGRRAAEPRRDPPVRDRAVGCPSARLGVPARRCPARSSSDGRGASSGPCGRG